MRTVLVVNADHDLITNYLRAWSDFVLKKAAGNPNIRILQLNGADATKKNLEDTIAAEAPAVVILNGHGDQTSIGGYNKIVMVEAGVNSQILAARDTHGMACSAGAGLGPDIIQVGGRSFIGYKDEFRLWSMKAASAPYTSDPVAAFQMQPAFVAIEALILGDTPKIAFQKSQAAYANMMVSLQASTNTTLRTMVAPVVDHNWSCQVLLPP